MMGQDDAGCGRMLDLHRAADGALGFISRVRLRRHLRACPGCARQLAQIEALRGAIRDAAPRHRAPPQLAARIGTALAREPGPPPEIRTPPWRRLPVFAAGLSGAVAGALLMLLVQGPAPGGPDPLAGLVDSHIRSLVGDHLMDVASTDQHTVKPWLSAHVDVSPPIRDFSADGFPLVGGRADYVDGHPAAVAVYRSARHVINLFAWAARERPDEPVRTGATQGFNVVTWRQGGIGYAALSDVNLPALRQFTDLFRGGK